MGALSLTGKDSIRVPSSRSASRPGSSRTAMPLRCRAVGTDCAAVFLEPTLGEGGVVCRPPTAT